MNHIFYYEMNSKSISSGLSNEMSTKSGLQDEIEEAAKAARQAIICTTPKDGIKAAGYGTSSLVFLWWGLRGYGSTSHDYKTTKTV